jgi:hypothetical protein
MAKRRRSIRYIPCAQMPRDPTPYEEVEAFLLSMRDIAESETETIKRYMRWLTSARNQKKSLLPRY